VNLRIDITTLKVVLALLLGALIITISGCQTDQTTNTATTVINDPLTQTNRYGLSLGDAHDKSLKLEPGMTQSQVVSLLCTPDETEARTFGSNTQNPWEGVMWTFHWGSGIWRLNGSNPHDTLTIIFEKESETWAINSWQWSGP
jgi:hypothetical protein